MVSNFEGHDGTWQATQRQQRVQLSKGSTSVLAPNDDDLLKIVFEQREHEFTVSNSTVVIKDSRLMSEFERTLSRARYQSMRRWIRNHNLVHKMGTPESQQSPSETAGCGPRLCSNNPCKTCTEQLSWRTYPNMDQTPDPITFNAKKTLELIGQRTIHIWKPTSDTKTETCAMTVTASGCELNPYLVFTGSQRCH